jgi:hypothetical protein
MIKLSELRKHAGKKLLFGEKSKEKQECVNPVVEDAPIQEHIEAKLKHLSEADSKSLPPNMLILKRKSIRQFPNGQQVVLYYADKIKKYISIPYEKTLDDSGIPAVVSESKVEGYHITHHEKYGHVVSDASGKPSIMGIQSAENAASHLTRTHGGKSFDYATAEPIGPGGPKYMRDHIVRIHGMKEGVMEEVRKPKAKPKRPTPDKIGLKKPLQSKEKLKPSQWSDIQNAAWGKPTQLVFKNGEKTKLASTHAKSIMKLHDALSPDNQKKLKTMALIDAKNHETVRTFAAGAGLNNDTTNQVQGKK